MGSTSFPRHFPGISQAFPRHFPGISQAFPGLLFHDGLEGYAWFFAMSFKSHPLMGLMGHGFVKAAASLDLVNDGL